MYLFSVQLLTVFPLVHQTLGFESVFRLPEFLQLGLHLALARRRKCAQCQTLPC